MNEKSVALRRVMAMIVSLAALSVLPACDGRVMVASQAVSLSVAAWMVWSTLNLGREKG